jgi:ankyrin repeat protein
MPDDASQPDPAALPAGDNPRPDDQLFEAAAKGDIHTLATLLDQRPDRLYVRSKPYEWSLLHVAAHRGHLPVVDLLLKRGFDVNTREKGDNSCAMHWAAAAGHLDIVRRLADAGGDLVGRGDDHALDVIGWATCWAECDDPAHRAVADFLVSRGARHHIFSAISLNLAGDVRCIVADDPSALNRRLTRNEDHRTPLHHAVLMKRPEMIALLIDLGADPLAVDGSGQPAAAYATAPDIDRPVMEKIRAMTGAELISADRGDRPARARTLDLVAALALGDADAASRLVRENADLIDPAGASGVLHLAAKRNDVAAVEWLIQQGANPNGRWAHWDAMVTPLHLAAAHGHASVVRLLLAAGADPNIRDSKHDGGAIDWARHFEQPEVIHILETHRPKT